MFVSVCIAAIVLILIGSIYLPRTSPSFSTTATLPPLDPPRYAPMDNLDTEPMLMSEIADELQVEPARVRDYLEGLGHRIKGDPPLSDSIVSMVRAFILDS